MPDPEESARHLALAVDGPSAEVASRLEAAARFATARGAPSSAGELLELAIGLTQPDDRATLCERNLEAARCWGAAGDTARSVALCKRAVELARPGSDRVEALTNLGRATAHSGDCSAAAALFAEALAEPCDDTRVQVSLEKELVWNDHMLGDLRSAEQHAHNAVALAEALGERTVLVEVVADLALIQMLRRRAEYRETMDRALTLEREERRSRPAAVDASLGYWWMAEWQNAMALAWAGELDAARVSLEALQQGAVERGDEQAVPYLVTWLSRVAFLKDDWPTAARLAEEGCEASVSAPAERAYALVPRGVITAHLGDVKAAREATDEGLRLAEQVGMVSARIEHEGIRGGLELSLGDLDGAYRFLAPLPGRLDRHGFAEPAIFRFHPDLIETLVGRGEITEAKEQLAELEAIAERFPRSWAVGAAARCRGLLAAEAGEHEDGFAAYRLPSRGTSTRESVSSVRARCSSTVSPSGERSASRPPGKPSPRPSSCSRISERRSGLRELEASSTASAVPHPARAVSPSPSSESPTSPPPEDRTSRSRRSST